MAVQQMVKSFDRITVHVDRLDQAIDQYRLLLGTEPEHQAGSVPQAWFCLSNTVIELVETGESPSNISGLVLADEGGSARPEPVANTRELDLSLCDGTLTGLCRELVLQRQFPAFHVDHLVLRTGSAEDCIELFRDRLGIRLALDQSVPEWGGRMLFFRAGKMTLEVIESADHGDAADTFWGIAFQCNDLDAEVSRLEEAGVKVSGIREGRKPGTRVATVKSHCLGIPTLLIEPN